MPAMFSPNGITFDKGRPKTNRFNEENWYGDIFVYKTTETCKMWERSCLEMCRV